MNIEAKIELIREKLNKPLVFVGLMGAGKTSVGQAVAQTLGLEFVDSDDVIVNTEGCSIAELFKSKGEPYFRGLERQTIIDLAQIGGLQVIGTGGGAFMNDDTREAIKENTCSVFLNAELDVLLARVGDGVGRPLFEGSTPEKVLKGLISERYSIYAKADIAVETKNESIEETLNRVVEALYTYTKAG